MAGSRTKSRMLAGAGLLALALAASAVAADQAPPAPGSSLGSSPARLTGKKPRSLAEFARDVRLAQPGGAVVVVSDSNLRQLAADGRISAPTGPAAPAGAAQAPTPNPREEWEKRYQEKAGAVKEAEKWLNQVDQARSQARDAYQTSLGPYSQAPGTVSASQNQRDEAARKLAQEQENLKRLQEQGRRLGVTPDHYPTPVPQPSPQPTPGKR